MASDDSDYGDESPEYEAFARRVFDLVAPVGNVAAYTTGVEFFWVIDVSPRRSARSLSFKVMLSDFVVIADPRLGWWTFEWEDSEAAWAVIEQIVARGGIVYNRFAWTGASELRDLNDAIVSGPHNNGGLRLRSRRSVYEPYA